MSQRKGTKGAIKVIRTPFSMMPKSTQRKDQVARTNEIERRMKRDAS